MKVMIVDNHIIFREGLVTLLKTQSDVEVVGESNVSERAIQIAADVQPDIILMDVGVSQDDGIHLMNQILVHQPGISFFILTTHDSDNFFYEMISNGAKGYTPKNITKSMLFASLRALGRGEAVIPRSRISKVLSEFSRLGKLVANLNHQKEFGQLTHREMEILKMLVYRATNREIATKFSISENTVRVHVSSILKKLKLRNRREASAFAIRATLADSAVSDETKD